MMERGITQKIDPASVLGTREHAERITAGRHPGVRDALQWLAFSHLPDKLQRFSRPFYLTAVELITEIRTDSPELTTTLNTLIAAKDSGMRAGIKHDTGRAGPVPRPQEVVNPPRFSGQVGEVPIGDPSVTGNYGAGQARFVGGIPLTDPGCVSNGYHNTSCACLRNSVAASGARPIKDDPQA